MILAGKVGLINGVEGYQVYTVLYLALGESVEVLSVGISHHAAKGDEDTTMAIHHNTSYLSNLNCMIRYNSNNKSFFS